MQGAHSGKPDAPEKTILNQPGVVIIGGGIPIEACGSMVGAIGICGAPGGDNDDISAKAGIAAITDELSF
jgi:uncharacterized protein GlcG (DUF336 family)